MSPCTLACFGVLLVAATQAGAPAQSSHGPTVELLIPMPEPRPFLLALDEIELDWTAAPREARGENRPPITPVPGTRVVSDAGDRTLVRVETAKTADGLAQVVAAHEAANPGARGELVVYEVGRPRSETSRRMVTSDVALLLDEGVQLDDVLSQVKVVDAKAVRGTPRGYVIRCTTPLTAIDVAKALIRIQGVKRAYPLLKRTRVTR
jgi:hypothetical protein